MPNSQMTELLASYVPRLIQKRIAQNPTPIDSPKVREFQAAVLFVDISGFTALTERLAERGPTGVERLARILNDYFGRIIDLVYEFDGDVVKYAGDGLIAVWPMLDGAGVDEHRVIPEAEKRKWTLRAVECAFKIKAALLDYEVEGSNLDVKCSLATGRIWESHIGGIFNRWEFVLVGQPLIEIGNVNSLARAGDVVASQSAWELIKEDCESETINTDSGKAGVVRLIGLKSASQPLDASGQISFAMSDEEARIALRPYIPGSIFNRISAGQSDWLAELRKVTVVFINLPEIGEGTSLETAQELMRLIQRIVYRFEGSINKISQDDKGITVDAAFGLPPFAHADDPIRGMQAALMIRDELRVLGVRGVVSLTTGRVFCGLVGTNLRREYTFLGNSVNLAGRLMSLAFLSRETYSAEHVIILCDRQTYTATHDRFEYDSLPVQKVKGRSEPVDVFHPLHQKKEARRTKTELIGRRNEKKILTDAVQEMKNGSQFKAIILHGEAGIGKSRLMDDFVQEAQASQVKVLKGGGDSIEKNNPYFAWRSIFNQIFSIEEISNAPQLTDEDRLAVIELVTAKLNGMDTDLVRYAPLLNVVLPISIPDNELTSAMTNEVRGGNIRELLVRLLQAEAKRSTLMIALEDVHWLDSASWSLLGDVHHKVRPLLLVVNTRQLSLPAPAPFKELAGDAETHFLKLDMLSLGDVEQLVCQRLSVNTVPPEVGKLIRGKSEGHPFFAEELAYALRDSGVLVIQGDQCHLAPGLKSLDSISLPDNLESAITSRIDGLNPSHQLTLKVASVIGRIFAFRLLHAIHPIESDKPELNQYLDTLTLLRLTLIESESPDLTYLFKHVVTQEVAYNLMLYSQRRQLHQAVAEWMEVNYGNELASYYALLAYHWTQAAVEPEPATRNLVIRKAVDYLEKAGNQSLNNYANAEAVQFFNDLLKFKDDAKSSRLQLGQWYRKIALGYLGLGNLLEARRYSLKALETLGQHIPASSFGMIAASLGEVGRQISHRLFPKLHRRRVIDPQQEAIRMEIVQILQDYAAILFLIGDPDPLPLFHCVLTGLNTAESIRDSAELAYMYAQMAAICGFIGVRGQFEHYREQCRTLNERFYSSEYFIKSVLALATVESGIAEWKELHPNLEKVIEICASLGDQRQTGEALSFLSCNALLEGNVPLAEQYHARMLETVQNHSTQMTWYYSWSGALLLRLGKFDEGLEYTKRELALLEKAPIGDENVEEASRMYVNALWHIGDRDSALMKAKDLLVRAESVQAVKYTSYIGFSQTMDVIFLGLERAHKENRPQAEKDELMKYAKLSVKIMKPYARVFTVGRPFLHRYKAWVEWYSGKREKACGSWRRACEEAHVLPMHYEEGISSLELADHLPAGSEERRIRYEQARDAFAQGGFVNWVAEVDSRLMGTVAGG